MTRVHVSGRGHGKVAAQQEWLEREIRRGREIITDFIAGIRGDEYPWASSIHWSCSRPTDPVYQGRE